MADFESADKGTVVFTNVQFAYASRPRYNILQGLNLTCAARTVTGIMGSSGGGKTTLLNLLMRYYNCSEGEVTVDGVKVQDYDKSFTTQVGYVSGEPVLFGGTIRDNIEYGIRATDENVIQAAKFGDAHMFIQLLPGGYDTELTKDTVLSSSQVMRISVARMFCRNPSIIAIDNACASFDAVSAQQVRSLRGGDVVFAGRDDLFDVVGQVT